MGISRTADGKTVEQGWLNSGTSDGGTVYLLMVEPMNNHCERVEQRCCNSRTFDGGTVKYLIV